MAEKKNFEKSITELGDIVRKLEDGSTPLEQAMKLFESGVKLSRDCMKMLDDAEEKVNVLIEKSKNGGDS